MTTDTQHPITDHPELLDLPASRKLVFTLLFAHDGLKKRELIQESDLSESTIERCISDLHDAGFIEKAADPTDPRAYVYSPSF